MSTGYLMIYGGAGVLCLAVILTVVTAATTPSAKRKLQENLAEKY